MRDFKGMKRQRGRNRRSGGGQGGQSNNPNRSFDSTGPEGIKVRGNAQTVLERYQQLARDATSSGDRVLAENYLQHAEHYFRLLRIMQPNKPVTEIAAREGLGQGFDIDFEDESGAQAAQFAAEAARAEAQAQAQGQQQQQQQQHNQQPRREDREEGRDGRRDEARSEGDGEGREGGRRESRRERYERRRQERFGREDGSEDGGETQASRDPLAVIEPEAAPSPAPAREAEADHMPSFLTRPAPAAPEAGEAGDAPAPRKRGRPKKAEAVTADEEA